MIFIVDSLEYNTVISFVMVLFDAFTSRSNNIVRGQVSSRLTSILDEYLKTVQARWTIIHVHVHAFHALTFSQRLHA